MIAPSRVGSWLLELAVPMAERDAVIGDLLEEFTDHIVPRRGVHFARWWYRWQVTRSLARLFFRSWQRASFVRSSGAVFAAASFATLPATTLLLVRSFVLKQVPLKTTPELSLGFGVVLATVVVATLVIGLAIAARVLDATRR